MIDGSIDYGSEPQDDTTFDDTTRINKGGLLTVGFAFQGRVDAGVTDGRLFKDIPGNHPITVSDDGAAGDIAHFFQSMQLEYSDGGAVGEMHSFNIAGATTNPLIRGTVMHNGADTGSSSTGRQLGAKSSAQTLYGVLHVVTSGATTLDIDIESDDNSGFTSATTRASFTQYVQALTDSAQIITALKDTEVTDDWWRITSTIGSSASYSYMCAVGFDELPTLGFGKLLVSNGDNFLDSASKQVYVKV